jgi:hypothetical protein
MPGSFFCWTIALWLVWCGRIRSVLYHFIAFLFILVGCYSDEYQMSRSNIIYNSIIYAKAKVLHVLDDLLEEAPPVDKCMVTVSCCLLIQLLCQEIRRTKYNLYCFTCILFSMPLSWGVPWFHYLQVYRILLFMGHLLHWDCCFFWEKVTDLPHNYFGSDLARQTSFPLVLEGSPAFGGLLGSGFSDLSNVRSMFSLRVRFGRTGW